MYDDQQVLDLVLRDPESFFELMARSLLETESLEQMKAIHDEASLIKLLAGKARKSLSLQNQAAEVTLRAERKVGLALATLPLRGGNRQRFSSTHGEYLKLEALGLTRNESNRWQAVAAVDEAVFEAYIAQCKRAGELMTRKGLIRYANSCHVLESPVIPSNVGGLGLRVAAIQQQLHRLVTQHERYGCLVVLPPWPTPSAKCRVAAEEMRSLLRGLPEFPISELSDADAHLHLWSTSDRLCESLTLVRHWGFKYRDALICRRNSPTYGRYWRKEFDVVLLGVKGNSDFRRRDLSGLIELPHIFGEGKSQSLLEHLQASSQGPYLGVFLNTEEPDWTSIIG